MALTFRAYGAYNRRNLDALLALIDPDVEFVPYRRAVDGGRPYHGHEGVRRWWDDTFPAVPDFRAELDEVRGLGHMTLVSGRIRAWDTGGEVSVERRLWSAVEWRNAKVVWWRTFESEAEALEAVALRGGGSEDRLADSSR